MGEMAHNLEELKKWIGQKESAVDYVTVPAVHRLAATLDRDDPMPKVGDPLPIGWHAILFPRVVRHSQIGADGHPERGDFLPPVPLPRRMFAGKRTNFVADLHVGDKVHRESTIKEVNIKQGRSGQMVFVTVKTDISSPRGLAITEEQDIVYRGEPDPKAPPPPPQPAPGNAVWSRVVTPDPVMLFRYSALTFNGHRIHYDHRYVTGTEGYPDLVMNGGLTTLLAYELARTHASTPIRYMSSRNVRALFVNRPISFGGEPSADNRIAKLWAADPDGALALTAEAEFK
ncbi:MAG TPA: MaoC family dehydratase N-terminal domain-containing protein [Burkholderiales bacterium]|jgi:3-methylfumaryl-CoA hydratase|nr:MaoC family dehydratase N-terminal domain-containing protein [Burkholderiales bacterium]